MNTSLAKKTKSELEEYSKNTFDHNLNINRKKDILIQELQDLELVRLSKSNFYKYPLIIVITIWLIVSLYTISGITHIGFLTTILPLLIGVVLVEHADYKSALLKDGGFEVGFGLLLALGGLFFVTYEYIDNPIHYRTLTYESIWWFGSLVNGATEVIKYLAIPAYFFIGWGIYEHFPKNK